MSQLDDLKQDAIAMTVWEKYRFLFFVGGCILLALVMVFISLRMYISSGAYQLDLSLPVYQKDRSKIDLPKETNDFAPTGPIDANSMADFKKRFEAQLKYVTGVDNFTESALSDEALGLPGIQSTQ